MLNEVRLLAIGGDGGEGLVSFRRERYVPRGGPDGGDGGRGGAVVIEADGQVGLLDGLRGSPVLRAEAGGSGGAARRQGRAGRDAVVKVPLGTVVWRIGGAAEEMADLCNAGARVIVARGGNGGRGNARLATAKRRVPRIAERGLGGERVEICLELRLVADVGLVGLPNGGKSSLMRAMTRAMPKVAEYAFTTAAPVLGVLEHGYERAVVIDLPAVARGASGGSGLGVSFLQHARRARVVVVVADAGGEDPGADIRAVRGELEAFGHGLCEKSWLVALSKIDLPKAKEYARRVASELTAKGIEAHSISVETGEGVEELVEAVLERLRGEGAAGDKGDQGAGVSSVQPALARHVKIVRIKRGFEVRGEKAVQVVTKLGVGSEEARAEVARRLRRAGVLSALRRAGVQPGDRVRIGGAEMEWPL